MTNGHSSDWFKNLKQLDTSIRYRNLYQPIWKMEEQNKTLTLKLRESFLEIELYCKKLSKTHFWSSWSSELSLSSDDSALSSEFFP